LEKSPRGKGNRYMMDDFQQQIVIVEVPINSEVLRWARERAGLSIDQLTKNFVDTSRIRSWENSTSLPTLAQAETLATKLRIPLPILLLDQPPKIPLPIPDLRTLDSLSPGNPTPEFVDTVNDAVVRQSWYREYVLTESARPLAFVGQFNPTDNVSTVARSIRTVLQLDERLRLQCRTWQDFLSKFVQRADSAGIIVMRNSVFRHDNTRRLLVDEFRGFAISDAYAPLVFVNSRDAKAAQIFTLAHELAHIWLGATGISNPDPRKRRADFNAVLERTCNEIAAEVLVPQDSFLRLWSVDKTTDANVKQVAAHYRVSSMVALRRANDLGKINAEEFKRKIAAEYARFRAMEKEEQEKKEEERSGNFWNLFAMRNGQRFTDAVANAARREAIPFIYASHLLGVKASTLENYIKRFQV
jgi:Zn-dependent peptidase ImmA (M78 family)